MSNDKQKSSSETAPAQPAKTGNGKQGAGAETPKILDEIAKKTGAKAAPPKHNNANLLALVVVIVAFVGAIAYLTSQQRQMNQALADARQNAEQLNSRIEEQSQRLAELQAREIPELPEIPEPAPSVSPQQLSALEAELTQGLQSLRREVGELQMRQVDVESSPDQGWRILEAAYLVSVATRRLQLEADVATATYLLEAADTTLAASESSAAFAARQALAEDIARLREVLPVDRDGIYLRLENLAARIGELDLLDSMRQNFENRRDQETSPLQINADPGLMQSTVDFLNSVFVWRRWEERPEAMLETGEESIIKLNLRLQLQQAQLALMTADAALYRRSLASSGEWLLRYAMTDSTAGQLVQAELQELQQIDINPPLPDLSRTLNAVRQLAASER